MTSLFYEQPAVRRGFSGFALSVFVHCASIGLVAYVVLYSPRIKPHPLSERYAVRHLELNSPNSPDVNGDEAAIQYPGKNAGKASLDSLLQGDDSATPDKPKPQPPETATGRGGNQTLIQPKIQTQEALATPIPIPTVSLWSPELVSHKFIVAPHPDMPTASTTKPSLDAPNQELNLADQALAATVDTPKLPTPPAGTTSPIVTQVPAITQMAPATISVSHEDPTPTALLSVSELRMPLGSVTIPPVNETKSNSDQAQVAAAVAKGPGTAKLPGTATDAKVVLPSANPPAAPAGAATANTPAAAPAGTGTAKALQAPPSAGVNPPALPDPPNSAHITLPRDGKFSVVVVGTSLADEYPQTLQIWSDRTAYTAYLHVGLPKNWILQYAQVRSADVQSQGTTGHLEAPWPYDMFRPNLIAADLNADALMVHGVVDEQGHFENLAIAFPADFDRASLVLHALQRWQFRPAQQNGKPTSVEVLLIIPDEME